MNISFLKNYGVEVLSQNTDDLDLADIVFLTVKPFQAEAVINEINLKRAGYYTLILTGDGEIYLRLLSRTTEDPQLLYELMVFGSATARLVYPELEEKINGKKVEVLKNQPKAE
jgi:hypothetical protein